MGREVYFVQCANGMGPVKVGCTSASRLRVYGLEASSPFPLKILVSTPGGFDLEKRFHARYLAHRSHGEWFHMSDTMADDIDSILSGTFDFECLNEAVSLNAMPTTTPADRKAMSLWRKISGMGDCAAIPTPKSLFDAISNYEALNLLQRHDCERRVDRLSARRRAHWTSIREAADRRKLAART